MTRPITKRIDGYTTDVQAVGRLRRALEKDAQFGSETRDALIWLCDTLISILLASPERAARLLPGFATEMSERYGGHHTPGNGREASGDEPQGSTSQDTQGSVQKAGD